MNLFRRIQRFFLVRFPREKDPTKRIISFWQKGGADFEYFASAEKKEWMDLFWKEGTIFFRLFRQLNPDHLLEIASGTGRHSFMIADKIKHLYLLDSSAGALEKARQKFSGYHNITFLHHKDGLGIPVHFLADETLTAVFSYDAMVHFEKECVLRYVKDSYRVLKPGGRALFHYSNYDKDPEGGFTGNKGWRNYMSQEIFTTAATSYGFRVLHSEIVSFSFKDSDCVTLLEKPGK
jgi:ubiquinone/menaquinone biosynthesis C-methylase UbiE